MDLSINCPVLAGRVAHWQVLTQDQRVLQTVAGYQLELLTTQYQARHPQQMHCSLEEQTQIIQEVSELLFKGMITETNLIPKKIVSQIFLVEKKGEGQRLVVNLRGLNQFVKVEYFKMEGQYLLLQARDWMIKLDLKDAYLLLVPIHPEHQKHLVFQWNSKWYQFTCLPFGLSAAPRAFTKLSSRLFEADEMLSDNLSGPHLDPSPGQGPVTSDHTISMSAVGVSEAVSKQQEIIVDTINKL